MAKELVLVSHGRFCEELKASTEMIIGPQESKQTVELLTEEGCCVIAQHPFLLYNDYKSNPVLGR